MNIQFYTPLSLCRDMLSSIDTFDGKSILVISNLEFLIVLKQMGIDMDNIHYTVNCELKRSVAINLGIDENKIYELNYNSKEIDLGIEDMKFDVIVMNPPYNEGILTKDFKNNIKHIYSDVIIQKAMKKRIDASFIIHSYEKMLKNGGVLTAVWPIKWMQLSSWQNFRNWNSAVGLHTLKILPRDTFKNADINVGVTTYIKNLNNKTFLYENKDYSNNIQKNNDIIPLLDNDIEESIFKKIKKA